MQDRQRQLDIQYLKDYLGSSFVRGVWIKARVAKVVVKSEGTEKETLISLPSVSN